MQETNRRAGVSSACFFPMDTLHSVQKLTEWKVPNIEIFFNSFQELKPGYLEQLAECCRASQTQVVSVHPFTSGSESFYFFTDYPGRIQDGLEIYRHFLHAANYLGAQLLVFHGASVFSSLSMEKSAEHFYALDRMAREEYGVTVAYENVVRSKSKEPDYLLELKQWYPQLACVLDVKQALRSGKDTGISGKAGRQHPTHPHQRQRCAAGLSADWTGNDGVERPVRAAETTAF